MYKRLQVTEKDAKEIHFNPDLERIILYYLDIFEEIKSENFYIAKYDKDCDIATTYIGKVKHKETR